MEVTEILERASLEALAPEWRLLVESGGDVSPFLSPDWLLPWQDSFLPGNLWTLAVRNAGQLVGLAPFFIYRHPDGARQVTFLGNGISDRLDLLAAPGESNAVADAVLSHLANRSELWDLCDFRDVPAESPLLTAPFPRAGQSGSQPEEPCPVVRLPAVAERVLELLPCKQRENLRRCARRVAEAGEISYQTADAHSRACVLAELMRIHDARWRAKGAQGPLSEPGIRSFHAEATARLLSAGLLRLHVLRFQGRAIAVQYCIHKNGRGYSYLTAFDPDFARFSPGLLLIAFTLQQAVQEGAVEFDFLRGREPYKYLWGARDRAQYRRLIIR
jgi:CelD/BcsL family acetyltransferase involved in cellulose biosynthesis